MCGIVGFVQPGCRDISQIIEQMANAIKHRGPDDSGYWVDSSVGIAFGHRRLSIIDLSPLGHQPMKSHSGRYVITFNGEIYNYQVLRKELEATGIKFISSSDTEVMLSAFEAWGVEKATQKFIGMFSYALWDSVEHDLYLGRDRMGEKPLYYGWNNSVFFFASELKAFKAHPKFNAEINKDALPSLFRYGYISAPLSIYSNIFKLTQGCLLKLPQKILQNQGEFSPEPESYNSVTRPTRYWSLQNVIENGQRSPFVGSEDDALNELERKLTDSVRLQMISDVPFGAFLSGGIDSTTIVALMQKQSASPVKTFTIGFNEGMYNEAPHAKAIAKYLKTEHTELYVSPATALEVIPKLPHMFCEPLGDSSQIPTFLVSQLARSKVTVTLSGDGGDELFAGYSRYFWSNKLWAYLRLVPRPIRQIVGALMTAISPALWNDLFKILRPILPLHYRMSSIGYKIHAAANLVEATSPNDMYLKLTSLWGDIKRLLPNSREQIVVNTNKDLWPKGISFPEFMRWSDTTSYLPDDILVKVDRASMAVSLESRVPLLDHRLVEYVWSLPEHYKVRGSTTKWLLRKLLNRYVPDSLIDREKMGFGIPLDQWLRGPLRDWGESLLSKERLESAGLINAELVRQRWEQHLSNKGNWHYSLWHVLMFQAWLEAD